MSKSQDIAVLGGWPGYRVVHADRHDPNDDRPTPEVWIELASHKTRRKHCGGCGRAVRSVHDWSERWVRDLPILDALTWLLVPVCRVRCPDCGVKTERIDWLPPYARLTRRLAESAARLCQVLPVKHVANHFALTWDQVKAADKDYLDRKLNPVDFTGVDTLMIDEFAIQKGHRYATVVADASTRRVLWVGRGRSRESIRPFFELLGEDGCRRIKAVAMDMSAGYELEVQAQCPHAEVVFDFFHVVAKYGREVIDRVRVDEANRVKDDKPARKLVKGSRWLLLRNAENVTRPKDRVKLSELLAANRRLMTVYVLKDDLKHLWDFKSPGHARRFWKGWYSRAIRSRIKPLKDFARRLQTYLDGILSHCRYPINTGALEGMNNKIKVIKRMAYGFRDDAYFFLKIRGAFHGNTG